MREADEEEVGRFGYGVSEDCACGLTLWNRVRKEEVRRKAHVVRELSGRLNQCMLRWFGHAEIMNEQCLAKVVMNSDAEGNRCRGRPHLGWMDGW